MGECTDFFAARRSDLRKDGVEGEMAFWKNDLGSLNKAFWFSRMLYDAPKNLRASESDYELVCSGRHTDHETPLKVEFLQYVISQLEELDKKVLSMPCDPEEDWADWRYASSDILNFDVEYVGTEKAIAQMKEVEKVLDARCAIDFKYPWQKNADGKSFDEHRLGTIKVREVLKSVMDKFTTLNDDGDWLLFMTIG